MFWALLTVLSHLGSTSCWDNNQFCLSAHKATLDYFSAAKHLVIPPESFQAPRSWDLGRIHKVKSVWCLPWGWSTFQTHRFSGALRTIIIQNCSSSPPVSIEISCTHDNLKSRNYSWTDPLICLKRTPSGCKLSAFTIPDTVNVIKGWVLPEEYGSATPYSQDTTNQILPSPFCAHIHLFLISQAFVHPWDWLLWRQDQISSCSMKTSSFQLSSQGCAFLHLVNMRRWVPPISTTPSWAKKELCRPLWNGFLFTTANNMKIEDNYWIISPSLLPDTEKKPIGSSNCQSLTYFLLLPNLHDFFLV